MDPKRAKSIFLHAVEQVSQGEWPSYLDEACGNDTSLRNGVELLLAAHEENVDLAEQARRVCNSVLPTIDQPLSERPGTQIGRYKLLQQIGEGGMGIVYMAEQSEPVKRQVAIKIIKPGMDTRQVIARFEAERQALAMMDHPNIAKVFEAGTTESGRPFFVMELVKGIPITRYCDEKHLSLKERLELMIPVCQAIQHAHQKGIIHRDVKPTNVLVAQYDGRPVPKVIDFGVAKATAQKLTERTMFTELGQVVGTVEYMSPEQAELNQLDIDTRSDIYSLGVLLYELLTGTTPFDKQKLRSAAFHEMLRIIREDEPPKPSTSLSTSGTLASIAANRQTEPARLSKAVHGELDWIVMKALEKDRNRRYETANAFAADIQRHLDNEAVLACPPSAGYRFRKFAGKHHALLSTAALIAASLILGTTVSLWQAMEATRARKLAVARLDAERQARREADEQRKLADQRLVNEKQARAEAVKQRQQASENLQKALDAVDQMLIRAADERLAAIPGTEPMRRELFQDALKFYDAFFKQAPDDPKLRISTAKAWARIGSLHQSLGDANQAQAARQEAIKEWEALAADDSKDAQIELGLANAYSEFGSCEFWIRYKNDSAEPALKRANALYQDLERRFPNNRDYSWSVAGTEFLLAAIYQNTGRDDLSERTYRHVVEVQRRLWERDPISGNHSALGFSLLYLAAFLAKDQQHDVDAESLFSEAARRGEEVVAVDPRALAPLVDTLLNYGDFLEKRGRVVEAETYYRRAIEKGQALPALNRGNPLAFDQIIKLPRAQVALANLLFRDSRHLEALMMYRAAGDLLRPGMVHPQTNGQVSQVFHLAESGMLSCLQQMANGEHRDEARKCCEELGQTQASGLEALLSRILAARAWEAIGDYKRALADYDAIVELEPANAQQMAKPLNNLAWSLATSAVPKLRDSAPAVRLAERAVELNPEEGVYWNTLGVARYRAGDWKTAITALEKSVDLRQGGDSFDWFFLAMAHWRLGEKQKGRTWYDQAAKWMEAHEPKNEELRRFHAEAAELLGMTDESKTEKMPPPKPVGS